MSCSVSKQEMEEQVSNRGARKQGWQANQACLKQTNDRSDRCFGDEIRGEHQVSNSDSLDESNDGFTNSDKTNDQIDNMSNGLSSIISLNIRGLKTNSSRSKIDQIKYMSIENKACMIALSETWLNDSHLHSNILLHLRIQSQ